MGNILVDEHEEPKTTERKKKVAFDLGIGNTLVKAEDHLQALVDHIDGKKPQVSLIKEYLRIIDKDLFQELNKLKLKYQNKRKERIKHLEDIDRTLEEKIKVSLV